MRDIEIKMTTKCRQSYLYYLHVEKWRTTQVNKLSVEESDPCHQGRGSSPAYTIRGGGCVLMFVPFHHLWALQQTQKWNPGTVWLKPNSGSTRCKFHLYNEVKSHLTFQAELVWPIHTPINYHLTDFLCTFQTRELRMKSWANTETAQLKDNATDIGHLNTNNPWSGL